jgi:hypothetical protein
MIESLKEALDRIPTQREKVLFALRTAGKKGITNTEFHGISLRWHARIRELCTKGYDIAVIHVGNGVHRYVLYGEPDEELPSPPTANEILLDEVKKLGTVSAEELDTLLNKLSYQIRRRVGAR